MDLERLVKERLNGRGNCSGHCQEPYELKLLPQKEMMIGSYACPSGYVSLIVHYGKELDLHAFKTFLSSLLEGNVTDEDLRVATRYNWDLRIEGEPEGAVLREAYWRQSYRRTKSDDPHRVALFQCTRCSSFYRQQISDKIKLCPQCRRPTA
jgi:hypothetical protein